MKNFIEIARDKTTEPGFEADPSTEAWAARAFSCIAILGGMSAIEGEIGDSLAELLAKAPIDVVVSGTMNVVAARATAMGVDPGNLF